MSSSIPRSAAVAAVVSAALAAGLLAGSASASAEDGAGVRVHDIQGTTRVSPLVGQQVTGVTGIVTGVRTYGSRGFWIQDPTPTRTRPPARASSSSPAPYRPSRSATR